MLTALSVVFVIAHSVSISVMASKVEDMYDLFFYLKCHKSFHQNILLASRP